MDALAPIAFETHAQAQKFCHAHVCALCRSALVIGKDNSIHCPEHGQAYQHNVIRRYLIEQTASDETAAKIELNQFGKTPRDPEVILKELGF